MLNNIENKGEFDGLSQITQMKNCAIGDAVAQLKMKWRNSRGAFRIPRLKNETSHSKTTYH
jgi:hypothetical protein